ncbi:MAG: recombination protein RecA [Candidatus Berkelbacteria bacterium Licking1014_7]|uniref:Protein RecA n=1 Tax=Candidatus Berkelbacteria bacterium Licking1014_7 TaxID=2017147 RepID=A0A554LK79_9BACT|nr:MAG: recombination protein RecA [Candidatus Berkelbacteria bacterium Licking1014_7]
MSKKTSSKGTATEQTNAKGKSVALESAISQIEKNFGQGSIMRFNDMEKLSIKSIPTGSISLDLALGVGGLPRGRVVEIFGPESSGKTTLALSSIASAQAQGGLCAFIDAEHAFDPEYAQNIGINLEELLISQPNSGEQALEITETLVRSNAIDIIVIDSVSALVPQAELEGEMGDAHVGLQARLMSQALRKLTAAISHSKAVVIFINQLRMKIGIMFGNPETTSGGMALKFYSSVRIDVRRIEQIKDGENVIGNRVRAKVVKNKVAPPFKVAEFEIIYAQGLSRESELVDLAVKQGIIIKAGAWFTLASNNEKLGQGREAAKQFLRDHPEISQEIEKEVLKK